jgi:esterase/lipase
MDTLLDRLSFYISVALMGFSMGGLTAGALALLMGWAQ